MCNSRVAMLWSSRRGSGTTRLRRQSLALLPIAVGAVIAPAAPAAEFYVQPTATLTAENDSNIDLDTGGGPTVQGYLASLSALTSIISPNSDSTFLTRVDYRDYPKDRSDDRVEAYLDFRSDYATQRSRWSINGSVDRRDEFNAELSSALFDTVNPVQPTNPTTGRVVNGETLTVVTLQPSYRYQFTPIISGGLSGVYQRVDYTPTESFLESFDYYLGQASLNWTMSQRSEWSIGAYGAHYDAVHVDSEATGTGIKASLDSSWTPLLSTSASVLYQHTTIDMTFPEILDTHVNLNAVYKSQLNQYRFSLGRMITPSGGGGVYVNEQVQLQYTREWTERLSFTGAVIGIKSSELPANVNQDDRRYLQTVVEAKWMIRPTWFLQGGYQYTWQKYDLVPDGAANNRIYIRVGYQGLNPQR
jgi:hypothetical protein